jgi:hypothetical protein
MTYTVREPTDKPEVLDEHRLLFPSHAFGFSAKIVEIPTGKFVRSLVPLWWVPWFVGVVAMVYLCGAVGWMRASAGEEGWAWLDIALVGGVALLILSVRLYAGDRFETYRSPHRFINGICITGLTLTVVWLVLGRSRLVLRGLPLLLMLACVITVRHVLWGDRPVQVWRTTMSMLVPVIYALLICLTAKLLRIGFTRKRPAVDGTSNGDAVAPIRSTFQLRDLLLAVACIAVLLTSLRPLLPTVATIGDTRWLSPLSIKGICAMLLVGAAMLSARRWIFFCAVALALVTAAALVTRDLSEFVRNEDLPWTWTYQLVPLGCTFSAGIVSFALFLLPYRLRGWRIGRRQKPRQQASSCPTEGEDSGLAL